MGGKSCAALPFGGRGVIGLRWAAVPRNSKQHVSETVAVGVVIGAFGSAWLGIAMLVIAGEKQPWLECPACGRAELAAAWVYQRVQESGAQPIQ